MKLSTIKAATEDQLDAWILFLKKWNHSGIISDTLPRPIRLSVEWVLESEKDIRAEKAFRAGCRDGGGI